MKLTRPIITFDLESTGVDTDKDRIVQIAAIKKFPDGTTEEKNYLINPTISIPLEASEVHGITDEMVKDKPTFNQYAQAIQDWMRGSDISGFNSDSFDVLMLLAEMSRANIDKFFDWDVNFVDVRKLFQMFYPNTLSDIYKRFFDEELENAHDALSDVVGTERILNHIINNNLDPDLTAKEIDELLQGDKRRCDMAGKIYYDLEGTPRWNFSKNKDKPILEDMGFVNWVLNQDFPQETKNKIIEIKSKKQDHV